MSIEKITKKSTRNKIIQFFKKKRTGALLSCFKNTQESIIIECNNEKPNIVKKPSSLQEKNFLKNITRTESNEQFCDSNATKSFVKDSNLYRVQNKIKQTKAKSSESNSSNNNIFININNASAKIVYEACMTFAEPYSQVQSTRKFQKTKQPKSSRKIRDTDIVNFDSTVLKRNNKGDCFLYSDNCLVKNIFYGVSGSECHLTNGSDTVNAETTTTTDVHNDCIIDASEHEFNQTYTIRRDDSIESEVDDCEENFCVHQMPPVAPKQKFKPFYSAAQHHDTFDGPIVDINFSNWLDANSYGKTYLYQQNPKVQVHAYNVPKNKISVQLATRSQLSSYIDETQKTSFFKPFINSEINFTLDGSTIGRISIGNGEYYLKPSY